VLKRPAELLHHEEAAGYGEPKPEKAKA
jgi:hypothetical protein